MEFKAGQNSQRRGGPSGVAQIQGISVSIMGRKVDTGLAAGAGCHEAEKGAIV